MEGRIQHLAGILEAAVIVEVDESSLSAVSAGCVVTIRYDGDDDVEKYLIGSIEERREGVTVMSPGSPLGKALLGASKGDTVSYEAPGGMLQVTVVDIEA